MSENKNYDSKQDFDLKSADAHKKESGAGLQSSPGGVKNFKMTSGGAPVNKRK